MLGGFRHVRLEGRGIVCELNGRGRCDSLRHNCKLPANAAIVRVMVRRVIGRTQMDGKQQPARHGDEGQARRDKSGGSYRACELFATDSHDPFFQASPDMTDSHAQAGHRPSRCTCWRLMINPLRGMTAIGSVMSVMHCVTPQCVHVKCGWHWCSVQ